MALGAEPTKEETDDEVDKKSAKQFKIQAGLLRRWDYNLRNRMGTLLRTKWDFANRQKAAEAYKKTFAGSDDAVRRIFDDERLKWLAATRNVLIHRGGVADEEFQKLARQHPVLKLVKEGEKIPLSAELAAGLVNPAVNRGIELITFADQWMTDNKE